MPRFSDIKDGRKEEKVERAFPSVWDGVGHLLPFSLPSQRRAAEACRQESGSQGIPWEIFRSPAFIARGGEDADKRRKRK